MKQRLNKWTAGLFALVLFLGLTACGSGDQPNTAKAPNQSSSQSSSAVAGLPEGFPKDIPFYTDAQVIEADNFNGNGYTVLYSVQAEYEAVVAFYLDAFHLDDSGLSEGVAYYEGFDFGNILINGLTIEESGDSVNVYMTLRDNAKDSIESEDYSDDSSSSATVTYQTAQEVTLSEKYPQDVVPVHPDAKVIGCSMVSGSRSGFVDLILPADDFEDAVSFYSDQLGLTPKNSTTTIQEAAAFKGEIDNYKVTVLISHLLSSGNDTLIQITVNET